MKESQNSCNNAKAHKTLKEKYIDLAYTGEYKEALMQHNLNKKKKRKAGAFSILFLLFTISVSVVCFIFLPYIFIAINSYSKGFDTSRIDVDSVPHIYDKDGNLICIMYGYHDTGEDGFVPTYSSVYTYMNTLPKYIGNAFTAIEDETFYNNSGISLNRLLYATFNYLSKGDSSFGGSTITQQLVKVATGDTSHSPTRKAREIGSALYLTDNWSKEKILGSYINLVYYGNGAYGIYEASLTYFDTEPKNLNIAQAAILASLPNSPQSLNPYADDASKERLFKRQKLVLNKMLELGLISQDEYTDATNFNIEFKNGSNKIPKNDSAINQYLNISLSQAMDIVKETYNCDSQEAIDIILDYKTKIHLNIDTNLQRSAYQKAIDTYAEYPYLEIGAVTTTKDGKVISIITSRTGSQIDHAYLMTRQTGSSIKPISVYGPAFDMGILTPDSILKDEPPPGTWIVRNADRTYRGKISTKDAIAYSLNTTAVATLMQVTLEKSLEYVKSFRYNNY